MQNSPTWGGSPSGCWEWEIEQDRFLWSAELQRLLNNSSNQEKAPVGLDRFLDCFDIRNRPDLREAFDYCRLHQIPIRHEFPANKPDGQKTLVRIAGDPVSCEGTVSRIIGCVTVHDEAPLTTSEDTASPAAKLESDGKDRDAITSQATELLFQLISEHAGDVLWTYDFQLDRYTYASPSVYRLRGFTPEEIVRQSLLDALTPESAAKAARMVEERTKALESGDSSAMLAVSEFDQCCKDGSVVSTEVMTTFVRNEAGRVSGIVGIARDITERLEKERRQQEFEKHIHESQKLESMDRIAGGIAHELNNLLTPIIGYTELIKAPKINHADIQEYADLIFRAATRARDLVGNLLDFSSCRNIMFEPTDLTRFIGSLEHFLRSITREYIRFSVELDEQLPPVCMNLDKIRQVIVNLVLNAQDAMPEGGSLIVKTGVADLTEEVAAKMQLPAGRYVQLAISDTGKGMAADLLPHIFEPFFTTKPFGTASGLGLAAVFGIVRQHQGHIGVESRKGEGCTFTISLPIFEGNDNQLAAGCSTLWHLNN